MRRQVVAVAAIVVAVTAASACRPVRGNRVNVLLITLETTRADHLSTYGYSRDTSPAIDRFGREGVTFERHITVSPRTNPSLASLLTGSYPHEHGVRNLLLPLEPDNRTLAEVLRGAGYSTGAIQTHPRLVRASGLAQGFDTYDDDFRSHALAEQACGRAADWIENASRGGRPWFFWIHLMDPHWTYDPPAPWRTRYAEEDPRTSATYEALRARTRTIGPIIFENDMPPDEVASFVALYDGEIRYTDQAVGTLLATLGRLGIDRKTLVILTADHGESLGEHDYFFEHGDLGSEPEIHIPLMMRWTGTIRPGVRVGSTESSIDIAPTVLDLAGLPAEPAFRGRTLRPYLEGSAGADRACLGETDISLHEENTRREVPGVAGKWRWLRRGGYKLVYVPHAGRPPEWRLYDLERDPGETQDAGERLPEVREALRRELAAWIAADPGDTRGYHISDETRQELRSLGYVN
ncbi:MAG TPA: sulfatase [Candidatus Polarisedimenticolaceae bacterium]|nr:sulfatase [Candidatus Polarisedimenticolaceae bacterium]